MNLKSVLLDGCNKDFCNDFNCKKAVNSYRGRWFITIGHAGFNSKANNGNGYASKASALKAMKGYLSKQNKRPHRIGGLKHMKGDNDMDNCYKIKTESLYERPTELDWLTDEYENITIHNHCVEISVYTFGEFFLLKNLLTEFCIEFTTNL